MATCLCSVFSSLDTFTVSKYWAGAIEFFQSNVTHSFLSPQELQTEADYEDIYIFPGE